jgi:hypothetical protein
MKHFVLIFFRLLSDSLVITQRIMKLVKNSKTFHSALHQEIIFIPFDKSLMTYPSLFLLTKICIHHYTIM